MSMYNLASGELRKENDDLRVEIERLKNQLEEKTYLYNKLSTESEYVIAKLHSIIKEVREYAIDNQFTAHLDIQTNKVTKIENGEMADILEILDKKGDIK